MQNKQKNPETTKDGKLCLGRTQASDRGLDLNPALSLCDSNPCLPAQGSEGQIHATQASDPQPSALGEGVAISADSLGWQCPGRVDSGLADSQAHPSPKCP